MSKPMRLTADQLRNLATALDELTKVRKHQHIDLTPYQRLELGVIGSDSTVAVSWDDAEGYGEFVVDDRNGD